MKFRQIGKSGLISSNLTLGTMIFGEGAVRSTSAGDSKKIIDRYLSEGGNHIDTADGYAAGRSEEIIGEALRGRRNDAILATKVRFPTGSGVNDQGLSRYHIMEGVHASLKRLQMDHIDLLYLHCFDPITPLEETIRALQDLISAGKVRYIGISNFKAWQMMKAQALCKELNTNSFIAAQYQYSLVKRDVEYEFFDLLDSEGIGLLPWGPLGGGFLTGKYERSGPVTGRIASTEETHEESWERRNTERNWKIVDQLRDLSSKYEATLSQLALAWILSKDVVSSIILGVRTIQQLEDNLAANQIELSREDLDTLDELSALPELYPYRMIDAYGQRKLN